MDKSYVDISVLNKKVDFFIEPFEWINPQKIIGFSKSDVRKEIIRLYEENEYEKKRGHSWAAVRFPVDNRISGIYPISDLFLPVLFPM